MSASERVAVLSSNPHQQRVSTGFEALDATLGGLYWGDNVVWLLDGPSPEPFFRAIARDEQAFSARSSIALGGATYRDIARDGGDRGRPAQPVRPARGPAARGPPPQPRPRPPADPVRLDGRDGAGLGRAPHARLLRPLLPDAAGVRRDRLLVDDRARDAARRPGHGPRRDAVRAARRRAQRARGQGRGARGLPSPAASCTGTRRAAAPCWRRPRSAAGWRRRCGRCAARATSASTTWATSRASRRARSRRPSAPSAGSRWRRSCG